MFTWARQVRNKLNGVRHDFDRQVVMRRVLGLSRLLNIVQRVHENKLNSSIENRCSADKAARTHEVTASALVHSEVLLRHLQQDCHVRLKRNQKSAWALSGDARLDMHRSEVGVGAGVGVEWALFCCSRHFKTVYSLTSLLLSVRSEPGEEASWTSIKSRALFPPILSCHSVQLRKEHYTVNFIQELLRQSA